MIDTLAFDTGRYSDITYPGWVSRYSFAPDWMVGINNMFFSFKNGNIYWHNSDNATTATFYGIKYPTTITTEFNDAPLDKKMFKTIHVDSDDAWTADLTTDMAVGQIDAISFVKKENDFFAYVRRMDSLVIDEEDAQSLSTQGVGLVSMYNPLEITFTAAIDSTAFAVGDRIFVVNGTDFDYVGNITDYGTNVINLSAAAVVPTPGDFIVVAKNRIAESFGLRGYYLSVTLTNSNDDGAEIFAVSSDVFKSFP